MEHSSSSSLSTSEQIYGNVQKANQSLANETAQQLYQSCEEGEDDSNSEHRIQQITSPQIFSKSISQNMTDQLRGDAQKSSALLYKLQQQRQSQQTGSKSLAESLRQRRELNEQLELERSRINVAKMPKQSDDQGTAFRIRPQTPKLNLLNKKYSNNGGSTINTKNQMVTRGRGEMIGAGVIPAERIGGLKSVLGGNKVGGIEYQRKVMHGIKLEKISNQPPTINYQQFMKDIKEMEQQQKYQQEEVVVIKKKQRQRDKQDMKTQEQNQKSNNFSKSSNSYNNLQQEDEGEGEDANFEQEQNQEDNDNYFFQRDSIQKSNNQEQSSPPLSYDIFYPQQKENMMGIANLQECFFEILDQDEEGVSDLLELNEKFLSATLDIDVSQLSMLHKIELRVDTSQHNLQATGEVLSSLEYLKLSDSIIKCFRDIGTSFRNVRVLWLNRCELKEVQGIQAFEQLEELYLAYNDIEELFDIGFLEQLEVLDLEGNEVKSCEQLYYLRRCQNLKSLNLKFNPVRQEITYYQKIQENVSKIMELDDEEIDQQTFFEKKTEEAKMLSLKRNIIQTQSATFLQQQSSKYVSSGFKECTLVERLINLIPQELTDKLIKIHCQETTTSQNNNQSQQTPTNITQLFGLWSQEAFSAFEQEPNEEEIVLVKTIKTLSIDKKAEYTNEWQQQYWDDEEQEESQKQRNSSVGGNSRPSSAFRRSFTSGFKKDSMLSQQEVEDSAKFRQSLNSFFKGTARNTALSSNESFKSLANGGGVMGNRNEENNYGGVSDLVANNEELMVGTPYSILKKQNKSSKKQQYQIMSSISTISGGLLPKDICSLIQEFHQDTSSFKKQVNIDEIRQKISQNSIKVVDKNQSLQSSAYNSNPRIKQIENSNERTGASSNNLKSLINLNGGGVSSNGPIKANRIVLKQSDVQFNQQQQSYQQQMKKNINISVNK